MPGWAAKGIDREFADIVTPRSTGRHEQSGSGRDLGSAPVSLPPIALSVIERSTRFDTHVWSERELSLEQERLGDMATFLERLLRDEYQTVWFSLSGQPTTPELFLTVTVDTHGRVTSSMRLNSTGSTRLDEAIDRWLHDQQSPLKLASPSPREFLHVLKVSLYEH